MSTLEVIYNVLERNKVYLEDKDNAKEVRITDLVYFGLKKENELVKVSGVEQNMVVLVIGNLLETVEVYINRANRITDLGVFHSNVN